MRISTNVLNFASLRHTPLTLHHPMHTRASTASNGRLHSPLLTHPHLFLRTRRSSSEKAKLAKASKEIAREAREAIEGFINRKNEEDASTHAA